MSFEGGSLLDSPLNDDFYDDKNENEYHDVSSSNRSISNSSLKTWHHQFLKIDFRIINNEKMSQKSVLVLRYITLELCITIHYTEIIIPLNQVRKFQLASNRNIYLELKKDFVRYYYNNPKGLIGTRIPISNDPTNVTEGENIFVFTPSEWVDINTLRFFEEGVRQLIIHQIQNQPKLNEQIVQVSEINSLIYIGDEKDQIESFNSIISGDGKEVILLTCNFINKKHSLRVSKESSFNDILSTIRDRYQVNINPNIITYKNQVNDKINLIDDEDWNSAKWEFEMTKANKIDLYFF
ncbi:hypothetical protein RhiirA5_497593 [Rhizophagus irregularis]|uniref:Uncharacterized protein n=4 Tax=Rhizophagus irregularis TaxID=588596 RepID=A0A2I1E5P0_9GLOM|nr:hypothetical protein GLOIN_2v1525550 [Rhizophagus irregularis DAOM 181602=DAOM 197198]EXX63194.1 hypothetical protein RirG_154570 [Rhizophagus irregularis DAOM 197198w]PKC11558.1 hypothetical protein RhiirA5_497593 [Rhizophagus irregularis]PKC76507.1 hypothetical protein RhiirA1_527919 [Rhizophagus irregularis]PKK77307.1 hypothetical protein RhiirC2_732335 [Rhizophagus irregularis]PKY17440.1 hypothetical protein RhiirB3_521998 [Rhizophagus irregularis]|eukprot:XP_025186598.1 hypothetical protein GLOIN_2v1525550 [Rhizophagus irregularis DAOM 181602=DAOM 197198]